MKLEPKGLHHVSALTADAVQNYAFYTQVLGLRLVKKTVNQDSPEMYHLFYADAAGSPGSDMTFFDFPRAARERRGNDAISLTTFRVTGREALEFWLERLTRLGVSRSGITEVDRRAHLLFEDNDGTRLALIDDNGQGSRANGQGHPDIPSAYQIQGLGYSGFNVARLEPTRTFLERGLNLREVRRYDTEGFVTYVFAMGEGGPSAELHVTERDDLPRHRPGAGGVHHVALRMTDEQELQRWLEHFAALGYGNSGRINRYYFRSIYLRDPNGLIIELATDGPGFASDEDLDTLGQRLALPPFLEPRRPDIERRLRPLALQD